MINEGISLRKKNSSCPNPFWQSTFFFLYALTVDKHSIDFREKVDCKQYSTSWNLPVTEVKESSLKSLKVDTGQHSNN